MNPSPTKPIVSYPTALVEDKELATIHDTRLPDYRAVEYGTPYPDQTKFPGLKLVYQAPLGDDDRMVRRVWAGDRQDQDLYNADLKYSGGSIEHPIIIRRYLFPEEGYISLPTGAPDSQYSGAFLVEEEITQPENRNGYIAVTRVFETIPGPELTGVVVTEKGQLAEITTQTVVPGTTVAPSALTVSASVRPDGKGKSVLEKVEVTELFGDKSFAIENPDPVPQKFRIAAPSTTVEETVEGTAAQPVLATGELAASEQQVTKFTKRTRKTSRSTTSLPVELTQTATTNEGLKATVEETLQVGDTSETPSATVSVESEAIGDGTYVVRKTTLPEVFDGKIVAAKKPEVIPERFRAAVPDATVSAIESASGVPNSISLGDDEVSKTEQRLTQHTKRVETVKRSFPTFPQLDGQTYDEVLNENLPYTEAILTAKPATVGAEATPLSDSEYLVKTLDIGAIKAKLQSLTYTLETEVNITLPDRLENFQVHWEKGESEGGAAGDPQRTMTWTAFSGVSYVTKKTDTASAQATIRPTFSYTLKRGYRGPAIAMEHIRFVSDPSTFSDSQFGQEWPVWNEAGGTIVFTGQSKSIRRTVKAVTSSYTSPGGGPTTNDTATTVLEDSTSGDISYHVAQIPPSIHGPISGSGSSHSASSTWGGASASVSVTGTAQGSIAASSPDSVSGGNFVVSKSFTPYKYGLWKVSVVTVDITRYL